MRKIAVFGVVFVVIALAVCLASCSSPSAVIYFSVNGEIVHSQVVTETSGLDDFNPSLADGTFLGWFTDEACTIPISNSKHTCFCQHGLTFVAKIVFGHEKRVAFRPFD